MLRIGLTALALLLSVPGRLYATDAIAAGIHLPVRMYCARNVTNLVWLVRDDKAFYRAERAPVWTYGHSLMQEAQVDLARTQNNGPSTAKVSGWKQAGIYGLEFAGAAVGTSIAAAGAFGVMAAIGPAPPQRDVGLLAFVFANPCLSATGVCFGGRLVGQKGSFWPTIVGGLAGGAVGTAGACGYGHYWASRHSYRGATQNAIVYGCILIPPALGAVIGEIGDTILFIDGTRRDAILNTWQESQE